MADGNRAMEDVVVGPRFWRGRRVFITGHTGFKGAWLSLLLRHLGAEVYGYALAPAHEAGLFQTAGVEKDIHHRIANVLEPRLLQDAIAESRAEFMFHLAAQPLVRLSYEQPAETFVTNVMGTVNVLEAVRHTPAVRVAIVVTSDKCYENFEWERGYTEADRLGGHDPYSSSKACAELVTAAYRSSFFGGADACRIASVRAGNVIGGGDWASDRLVPDAMRAFIAGDSVRIRRPKAVRPWQHTLDPLMGYLLLAQRMSEPDSNLTEGWNFGPEPDSDLPVGTIIERLAALWGSDARWEVDNDEHPHEAHYLKLDCAKAKSRLGWKPAIGIEEALHLTVGWYKAFQNEKDMRAETLAQIERYCPRA